jgi:glycosyltransferase involved in cell wall biosynthesis
LKLTQSSAMRSRICIMVSNDMTSDSRVDRQAEALALKGHEVFVLSRTSSSTQPGRELRRHYTILRYREPLLCRLAATRSSVGAGESAFVLQTQLRVSFSLCLRATRLVALTIAARLWLYTVAFRIRAHTYHCNDLDTLDIGALMALVGRKLVYDSHELYVEQISHALLKGLYSAFERLLVKFADVVISVNPFIAGELQRRYSLKKVHVVLNCPEVTHPQRSLVKTHARSGFITVLYHGGFYPERGLENLVLACKRFRKGVRLVMRGEGELEGRLRDLAQGLTNVTFERKVPMNAVVESAMDADIGVLPYLPTNLNHYYCSPNKLFEYIQAGLALVVSDLPFLHQVVVGNRIGLLFDPNSPDDIAKQINSVCCSKNLVLFKRRVRKVRHRYAWEHEKRRLYSAYKQLEAGS